MLKIIFFVLCCMSGQAFAEEFQLKNGLEDRLWKALESDSDNLQNANERSILGATLALKQNDFSKALAMLETAENNQDPLASLLKAEAYRRAALQAVSSAGDYGKNNKQSELQLAQIDLSSDLSEADVRLQAFADKVDGVTGFPLDLLFLSADVSSVFLVDKGRSRLFVYQRDAENQWQRVADEYVVTGAKGGDKKQRGDARTPNGIYRFTDVRHDAKLYSKYGPVVFPIDYPNALDALHGKNGNGIWMHGYPEDVSRRPPQDTRGCFALPNAQLQKMEPFVIPGKTWVVISEHIAFGEREAQKDLLASLEKSLVAWQQDWQSLDTEAYLSHYHHKFRSGQYDLKAWKKYKTKVNGSKEFIRVAFSRLNLLHDPTPCAEGEVVVAEFIQHYQSNNYKDAERKRLYLARPDQDAPWKILIEEKVEL